MTDKDRLAKLEADNAELQRRLAALEPKPPFKSKPMERYDPTEGMSMPPSAVEAMVRAVPGGLVGIARERPAPASMAAEPVPSQRGWRDRVPDGPVPGLNIMDQMMDQQDAIDRAERARRLGVKP